MAEISLGDVDLEVVLFRLTRHAQGLFGAVRSLGLEPLDVAYAGGDGPEDLAMNLLLRFFDPQDSSVRWREERGRPTTDGVYALLSKALDNDFLDLKKSKRYKTTVYLETEDRAGNSQDLTLEQIAVYLETPEGALLKQERRRRLIEEFSDDPEAQEILKLQLDPEGYNAFTNQELAQLLDTTVANIENRKKRVRKRLLRIRRTQSEGAQTHA
jgi:DNA-directed RNA polymerase specialized sigma24 family protein